MIGSNGAFIASPGPFSAPNMGALQGDRTAVHELIHAGIMVYGMQPPSKGPLVKWTQLDNGLDGPEGINNNIVNSSCSGGGQ